MDDDWKRDRIRAAREGRNPTVIAEMRSGFAVLADMQFLPGWCILLPHQEVSSLNDLSMADRSQFLLDMSLIGDAILNVCHPKRVNYDILGNTDEYLHAHVYPRYDWEPAERQSLPVWLYEDQYWSDPETAFSTTRSAQLMNDLRAYIAAHVS
ncbi:DeoR family transcriptional regulator [Bombiscardovia apis]|uniref:DeoR family transcriptional regulator n=1 Tax=Bombiscardovia apis TaxID=2932182 RepID=A0ABN6SH85_9BIFI|nr:HIT domain-containing protein [Bombiscardovia apis]BDR55380.1 DeoR family transcriptional regulator [Bombiscardovia apis]